MTPDEMRLYLMDKGATKPAIPKHERKANLDKFLEGSVAPKVVYHGTPTWERNGQQLGNIHSFDRNASVHVGGRQPSLDTIGSWFSTNPGKGGAQMYSGVWEGSTIYPVHLAIKNPHHTTFRQMARQARLYHNGEDDGRKIGKPEVDAYRQWLSNRGQDGIVIRHDQYNPNCHEFKDQDAWIALHPHHQVKSAIGNRGTYDPKEDDITKAEGGTIKHERKANLAKFMSDSKIKKRLYHATTKDFKEFKPGGLDPNVSGHAIWLSADPRRQPAAHNLSSRSGAPREGHNVMPVHVQAKNPMVLDNKGMLEWAQAAYAKGSKEFPELMPKEWADAVQEDYDSIIHADPHGSGDPHEIIMFHPNKIKSAIGNRGTYDVNEHDICKADGGAINAEPLGEDTVKWTSPLADTVNSHKLGSMSGEQWMSWLHANAPRNAKKEAHASGTFDWLPQQANASKEAIVKHMKANAPRIKVKKFENNPNPRAKARFEELRNEGEVRRLTSSERDEIEELEQKLEDTPKTKFDEHVLPGGKNYREMTLSTSNPTGDDYIVPAAHTYRDNDADLNRILHMRMNDRPYNGGKALNLEELQSDWAQQGRSSGFKGDKPSNPDKGLPSGPYVTDTEDWTRLGLHNAIKEAAEKGHHAVTWTNGDEQAKRWGNEGLKHYYDTVMPSVTNDILKRMGVKERVGKFSLGTGADHHGFHMTPEIVAHIKKHGLPRFATGGDISKPKTTRGK